MHHVLQICIHWIQFAAPQAARPLGFMDQMGRITNVDLRLLHPKMHHRMIFTK